MKYILLITLLLLTLMSFGQAKVGGDGALHATGAYAPMIQTETKGFSSSVEGLTERNAIPDYLRQEGMRILVRFDTTEYVLVGGITNADWQPFTKSAGAGSVLAIIDTAVVANHTIQVVVPHNQGVELEETPSVQVDNPSGSDFDIQSDDTNIYLNYPISISGTYNYHIVIRK